MECTTSTNTLPALPALLYAPPTLQPNLARIASMRGRLRECSTRHRMARTFALGASQRQHRCNTCESAAGMCRAWLGDACVWGGCPQQ